VNDEPAPPGAAELLDLAVAELRGRRREGQHAMVDAVSRAIDRGEHLLVQAGTGTGKSLAYLVPVVRHAVLADERVIVSTATLALQRQLLSKDLPLVTGTAEGRLPRPAAVALLKGWHNYLCRNRLAGGYPEEEPAGLFSMADAGAEHPEGAPGDLGRQVLRVRKWAEDTATGDRDDLLPGVSDRAWRQVSVTALECLGRRCPFIEECFPEQARARAHEADVVVTNHAMLGISASGSPGVLPEHSVLVVDEAHELPDRVTAQATVELSVGSVERAARLARSRGGADSSALTAACATLGAALAELPHGRLRQLAGPLRIAVEGVRDSARSLLTALRPEGGPSIPGDPADGGRRMATSAVLVVFEIAERLTGDGVTDGRDVLWVADDGPRGEVRLRAAPLAVAGLIRGLFEGRTAVLTSATLSLGGSFVPLARSVGLTGPGADDDDAPVAPDDAPSDASNAPDDAPVPPDDSPVPPDDSPVPPDDSPVHQGPPGPGEQWRGIDVGSPFDHARAGILYVARHLPPPGREPATADQLDEIADLVTAAGGATLGLFSSRRAAVAAAEAMRQRLDFPVLCQGDDLVPALVKRFIADDSSCLFGTLSLWQGVDVPGATCRLVIIDRIPFPRPDDPVRSARSEAVAAGGGNGFMSVAATHAALLLAQGAGRLIRTDTDRGVVAVLDPRLVTARYGTFLLRSMPPLWRTTDRDVALRALERLAGRGDARPDSSGAARPT
jgi:ATP-dependent DNA helicase DinG